MVKKLTLQEKLAEHDFCYRMIARKPLFLDC